MGWRAAPLPPPATQIQRTQIRELTAPATPRAVQAKTNVFFLNYDGVTVKYTGDDDATRNETAFQQFEAKYAPYGDGPKRDAVMQAVVNDWQAYGVLVTDDRPASGDYTMNMTGPSNPFGGGVLGIAPLDCDDEQTPNNITFAFHSIDDGFDASTTATTIGQEVAHSFGLEHVDGHRRELLVGLELEVLDLALLDVEEARPSPARAAGVRDGLVDRAALGAAPSRVKA